MDLKDLLFTILSRLNAIEGEISNLLTTGKTTLNVDEAAQFVGLSKDRIYTLMSRREIPHYRNNGKRVYFDRAELETWLKGRKIATNEELLTEAARHALTTAPKR